VCVQREPLQFEFTASNVSPDVAVVRIAIKEVRYIRPSLSIAFTAPVTGPYWFLFRLK